MSSHGFAGRRSYGGASASRTVREKFKGSVLPSLSLLISLVCMTGCGKSEPAATTGFPALPDVAGEYPPEAAPRNLPAADVKTPLSRYARIADPTAAAALYWSVAGTAPDYEALGRLSIERWHQTADPFKRKELLDQFKPAFEAQLAQAKANPYFVYETGNALDHYDLNAKAFRVFTSNLGPMGFSHYPGGNRDGGYALRFTNLKESMLVPVPDEATARAIEGLFKGLQPPHLRLYLFAQGTEPGNSYGDVGGYISAQITRIAILGPDGNEMAATAVAP